MSKTSLFIRLTQQENINFLLTNRIPRRYATLFMGWFSRIENPIVYFLTMSVWKFFSSEIDFSEAKKDKFKSLHDFFIRELKPGARKVNIDPKIITSPCDAVIGSHGNIKGTELFQAKGFPYPLMDLLMDKTLVNRYRDGFYITLRLKSTMYHHLHAPCEGSISKINYISGDTWNVNPISLKRVEKLFCKNERAILDIQLKNPNIGITMVPVAAILVASMRFYCLPDTLNLKYKGENNIPCHSSFKKGEDLGYFQHGSTVIIFATKNMTLTDNIIEGNNIHMGEDLFAHR